MTYVYVLTNQNGELYFGCSRDLKRRLAEHNRGKSDYTKGSQWRLVYYEAYFSEYDAWQREKQLKLFGQSVKHLKNRLKNSLAEISAG